MDRPRLVEALSILIDDYANWISEQRDRIGTDVVGFDENAYATLDRCVDIHARLIAGVELLADERNELVLKAFRFANVVMAQQRVRSIYALARRRGQDVDIGDFDERKNRSWRPLPARVRPALTTILSRPIASSPHEINRGHRGPPLVPDRWWQNGSLSRCCGISRWRSGVCRAGLENTTAVEV